MKSLIPITALLAAMATASPAFFPPTTKHAAAPAAPTDVPLCTFDPVEGAYVCPVVSQVVESAAVEDAATRQSNDGVVKAADCGKCQRDWDECMKVRCTASFPPTVCGFSRCLCCCGEIRSEADSCNRSGAAGSTTAITRASAKLSRMIPAVRTARLGSATLEGLCCSCWS